MAEVDLLVIGAGPGGYVAAIRAAQLGLSVMVVDKRAQSGGTCLNIGCIPSKVLLDSSHKFSEAKNHLDQHGILMDGVRLNLETMMNRKDAVVDELARGIGFLFRKNGVTFIQGQARLQGKNRVAITLPDGRIEQQQAKHILIATGSEPASLPGIEVDEERILSSTGALKLNHVPRHLVVVGGGYIGLELGSVWARLGAMVTVVEFLDRITPTLDQEVAQAFLKALEKQGINFKFQRKITHIVKGEKELTLHVLVNGKSKNTPELITCDAILLAIGRRPYTQDLGLEEVNVKTDQRGFIKVNERFETSAPGIYAIGDVIPGPMLAHKAEDEGIAVAEILAGQAGHVNYEVIPAVVYTSPEVASVGKTEERIPYSVGKFPFTANSRAKVMGETMGFVKILSHTPTDRILGVHILSHDAGALIAEAALAMEFGASSEDIARTCHSHPTTSEAVKEAAWAAFGKALHI
jgi:dihydrolipoamide dehydrogenase